jgi:hypothetical protein
MKYGVFGSSANPDKLSVTVQSFLMAILPVALILAKVYKLPFTESDFTEFIQAITAVLASAMFLFGIIRKGYYAWQNR